MSQTRHNPVTRKEFNELEARVTALEQEVIPPPVPGTGIQARRIVDLINIFGVNTFSSLDEHNVWGSWPADYSPHSVIESLKWILGYSGFTFGVREYHYSGRYDMQKQWFPQIVAAFPNMKNTICPGANMPPADTDTMLSLANDSVNRIFYVEGLNEPNTDFGSGEVPVNVTMDIQRRIWGIEHLVLGPSVVAGTPHPEGWITGYFGNQQATVNSMMDVANGHYYPPDSPDVTNTGYSITDYVYGLGLAYNAEDISLTEFHPTLYNSNGQRPGDQDWSGARDAYYALTTLFRAAQMELHSLWWYALFDYGTVYKCGLFPTNQNDPRETAYGLRALCNICMDEGDSLNFIPGKLDYGITGGDDSYSHSLYQSSNGKFFIALWRSLPQPKGDPITLNIIFANQLKKIEEFNISEIAGDKVASNYQSIQWADNTDKLTVSLDGSARIIRIVP
jgi:hypothetical protein